MYSVGSDIGGTFTDTVFLDENTNEIIIGKVLTTQKNPAIGAVSGIEEIVAKSNLRFQDIHNVMHGTTLVTNAIIERKGAKTGLITTKGFKDVLEIGREKRYELYDLFIEKPEPLVPRYLRMEVNERVDQEGNVLMKLNPSDIKSVVSKLIKAGIESFAVCFLHSFRNSFNEEKVKSFINAHHPKIYVSLSTEVSPTIREYERCSTTVANAYTQPLMSKYILQLKDRLDQLGFRGNLYIMISNGGVITIDTAAKFPIRVVESGPAAGALAATYLCDLVNENKAISLDMGGTTAKICVIEDKKPTISPNFEVARAYLFKKGSGLPISISSIDMIEIGAGGGSIASIDRMGLLKVGPESAGAEPGPICYDRGGTEPTVTDADLILGYYDPDYFLGGEMPLNLDKVKKCLEEKIARPLKISLLEAAWGIHNLANENMANAARVNLVEKGKDPREYNLIGFGGAGPIHAPSVAEKLGISRILIPHGAGVISAIGLLTAPFLFDFVRSYFAKLSELDLDRLNTFYEEMEKEGISLLSEAGIERNVISLFRSAEMRYGGQGHEINVPIPVGKLRRESISIIKENFENEYRRLYHRINPKYEIEGLTWRVIATSKKPKIIPKYGLSNSHSAKNLEGAIKKNRKAYFPSIGDYRECAVYDKYRLFPGAKIVGPAFIEERESTILIALNAEAQVDDYLNLLIKLKV